ncbi:30S ribosomal protein S9 [Candidatus Cyanaurora vandensis]|uniref:30S ribosomal protein S9 n=1 Tax=Candidatus Cyanaurora vandensis TaxID=2714958 RepID=UPI00257FAB36|nr:30S ribosomal protein S9 [Candidatus Cyanaurora vandensis]
MSANTAVYWGTGRRKDAVARVRLIPGDGKMTINGVPGNQYLQFRETLIGFVRQPLEILGYENAYDMIVNAHGGGISGQAGAIRLGVARALLEQDPDNRVPIKREGLLTRDPRTVESKKYGLRKARKAKQYSKR